MNLQETQETMDWSRWDMLWHSLGMKPVNYRNTLSWWLNNDNHRNHFAADPQGTDARDLDALVDLGYMERGRSIPGWLVYYHVTDKGIEAARNEFRARRRKANGDAAEQHGGDTSGADGPGATP